MATSITKDKFLEYFHLASEKAPKPARMAKSQYHNYLAIQLLEEMGNNCPSQEEIDFIETLVMRHNKHTEKNII